MNRMLGCAASMAAAAVLAAAQIQGGPAAAPRPTPAPFVQEVVAWLDRALGTSARKSGSRDLRRDVEAALARNQNVAIFLDRGFTGGRAPLMALTYAGGLHAFELTDKQAREAGLAQNGAHIYKTDSLENGVRTQTPLFRLERAEVLGGISVSGSEEIACTVVCTAVERPKTGNPTLRVYVSQGRDGSISYRPLGEYPPDGPLAFSVGPINKSAGDVRFGPTLVAVDILVSLADGRGAVITNTVAFLVDVRPDLDAFARLGLKLMDDAVTLLSNVKDAATATAANDEFQRFATRNKALVEAMERLQPTPEQNRDFETKYGGKLDAVARRLAEQVTRLEATDYGKAFLDRTEAGGGAKR